MLILVVYISTKAMSCKTLLKYSNKSKVQHMLQTEIFIFFSQFKHSLQYKTIVLKKEKKQHIFKIKYFIYERFVVLINFRKKDKISR